MSKEIKFIENQVASLRTGLDSETNIAVHRYQTYKGINRKEKAVAMLLRDLVKTSEFEKIIQELKEKNLVGKV